MTKYFYDTYALIEIVQGSPNYSSYQNSTAFTTIFNIAEFNNTLKKQIHPLRVDQFSEMISELLVRVGINDVQSAIDLRMKNRGMSIPDAIGYVVAKRLGVKFLTGDSDFKEMDNVEFVR